MNNKKIESSWAINSLPPSARATNHSDIKAPNVFIRAKNSLTGLNKFIDQLNNDANIVFLYDFKDELGSVVSDVLKFTPRISANSSYRDKEDALNYVKLLVQHIGFESYEPYVSDKDKWAVYVSLRNKKNILTIQKVGHRLSYNSAKPLKQEFINTILENHLAR